MKLTHIKNYNPWINANYNSTGLKSIKDSIQILKHLENNEERFNDPELIDKEMTKENKFIPVKSSGYKSIQDILKKCSELQDLNLSENAKGGRAPFRFLTFSLNLDPKNPDNKKAIEDWIKRTYDTFKDKFNIAGVQLHMNETAPHITFIIQNFKEGPDPDRPIIWGNFVNGQKVVLSGQEGRKLFKNQWRKYEQTMIDFSKQWKLDFKQAPTGEKSEDRQVQSFRRSLEKIKNNEDFTKKDWYAIQTFLKSDNPKLEKLRKKFDISQEQISNFEKRINDFQSYYSNKEINQEWKDKKHNEQVLIDICKRQGWPVEDWLEQIEGVLTSKSKQTLLIEKMSEEIDKTIERNEELEKLNKLKTIVKTETVYEPKIQEKVVYKTDPSIQTDLNSKTEQLNSYKSRMTELKKLFHIDPKTPNFQFLDSIIDSMKQEQKIEKEHERNEKGSRHKTL